jgi:formate hydrogenlyase transcriptional activator
VEIRDQRSNVEGQGSEVGGEKPAAEDGPLTSDLRPPTSKLTLADAEREHILGALRETGWVVGGPKGAAARLGMKRSTLYKKMKKLGIFRVD